MKPFASVFTLLASLVTLFIPAARAESVLPSGYEAIAGIASTVNGNQYILTDYVPSSCDITIEATVALTRHATEGIWCSRVGSNDSTMTLFGWAASNYLRMDRNKTTGIFAGAPEPPIGKKIVLTADYKAGTLALNGTAYANKMASGTFTPAAKLAFFASHSNGSSWGNYAQMSLYGVKVYDKDGALEREYVPARCVANKGTATELGLFETQEQKFFSVPSGKPAFEEVVEATVTLTEDAAADAWVLTVEGFVDLPADLAAQIAGNAHANLIKRGSGTLIGAPIEAYTGNLTIEAGIYRLAHRYDCGADNTGWIRVCDGATLELDGFAGASERGITGKTVYTTGTGFNGMGAIAGGSNWNSCSACTFVLEGDSLWATRAEFNFVNKIDLAGHTLTGQQSSMSHRWGISATAITNTAPETATLLFTHGLFRPESMNTIGSANCQNGQILFRADAPMSIDVYPLQGFNSYWPVEFSGGVKISTRKQSDPTDTATGTIRGPLTFKGQINLATHVQDGVNALINLKGTLTGTGTTDIGTGWVNYHTTANDYAGTVTVTRSPDLASADYRAGIGVMKDAVYSAAQTTFTDADLKFIDGKCTVSGPLVFTGEGQCRLTGGLATGERTVLSDIRKEGSGELLLSAGCTITDNFVIAGGKLRFPSKAEYMPVVGRAGLMGSETNVVCWVFNSPTSGSIPCVYDTLYPRGNDATVFYDTGRVKGPRTTMVRGYIWNRSGATQNWSFAPKHNDRVWFWLDDEQIYSNKTKSTADADVVTRAITPGAHKYVLITTSSATSYGPEYINWTAAKGSLYASLPIDFQGRGVNNGEYFSAPIDPGDGSLFTVDDVDTADLTDPFWLPELKAVTFAPGTEFDVGDYDYTLPTLTGFPTVSNVRTFTIGEQWLLDEAGLAAGQPMTVAGTLACAEGAELALTTPWETLSSAALAQLDAGLVIATANAFAGAPALSAELAAHGAQLSLSEDGRSLTLRVAADRYVKVEGGQVKVGYSIAPGKPYKEVQVDVYRDGALIATKYLGDGHQRFTTTLSYPEDGAYKAVATIRREGEDDVTLVIGETIKGAATVLGPTDGVSLVEAVAALGEAGGMICLLPGTYEVAASIVGVELTAPVTVIGLGDSPADVIVQPATGSATRLFTLSNAVARVANLTMRNGKPGKAEKDDYLHSSGGNVLIYTEGGCVENCILRDGSTSTSWSAGGGNAALMGGTLRNCELIGGRNNVNTHDQWVQGGGSLMVNQIKAESKVTIENCLIRDCTYGTAPVALYAHGGLTMKNCTVANCTGGETGGFYVNNKVYGTATLPQIVNCAVFGTARGTNGNTEATTYEDVCKIVPTYRNKAYNRILTEEQLAQCFVNCASANETLGTAAWGWLATSTPGFTDAANGDYTLTAESPLANRNGTYIGYAPYQKPHVPNYKQKALILIFR